MAYVGATVTSASDVDGGGFATDAGDGCPGSALLLLLLLLVLLLMVLMVLLVLLLLLLLMAWVMLVLQVVQLQHMPPLVLQLEHVHTMREGNMTCTQDPPML